MSPMHAENSPDESVRCDGGNVNVNRFTLSKERLSSVLLAFCLIALVALAALYRYDAQERDLDRYDDGQRQERIDKELADIRSELKTDHELIQAYGLKQAVKGK